jgi:Sigma-70 region 2
MARPEEVLDRPSRTDRQTNDTGDHTAASAGTSELVARASAGDQGAWDQLVERYGELVWAVARTHGLGRSDASEVSQVTWLLLTQHLASIQQPERLGDWLLRTATREAYRMCKLRGCKVATPMSTTGSDPSAWPGPLSWRLPEAGGGWPVGKASPPSSRSVTHTVPFHRSEVTMSKLPHPLWSRPGWRP